MKTIIKVRIGIKRFTYYETNDGLFDGTQVVVDEATALASGHEYQDYENCAQFPIDHKERETAWAKDEIKKIIADPYYNVKIRSGEDTSATDAHLRKLRDWPESPDLADNSKRPVSA